MSMNTTSCTLREVVTDEVPHFPTSAYMWSSQMSITSAVGNLLSYEVGKSCILILSTSPLKYDWDLNENLCWVYIEWYWPGGIALPQKEIKCINFDELWHFKRQRINGCILNLESYAGSYCRCKHMYMISLIDCL